jgi:hypothetical protein
MIVCASLIDEAFLGIGLGRRIKKPCEQGCEPSIVALQSPAVNGGPNIASRPDRERPGKPAMKPHPLVLHEADVGEVRVA